MPIAPSGHPSAAPKMYHNPAADETKVLVFAGFGNAFCLEVQNEHATDAVYLQVFDAATTAAVTLGTTAPTYSLVCFNKSLVRISESDFPAIGALTKGLVIAVTSTRTGSSAPAADAAVTVLYKKDA